MTGTLLAMRYLTVRSIDRKNMVAYVEGAVTIEEMIRELLPKGLMPQVRCFSKVMARVISAVPGLPRLHERNRRLRQKSAISPLLD